MSDDHPKAADDRAPRRDRPVELARPAHEDSNVFEGSRGMHLDPRQVPMNLTQQPAMDAGQPAEPSAAGAQTSASEGQPEAE